MTPIEVNPVPVQIGAVWYYEKRNCMTNERYISVESYRERYGEEYGNNGAAKPIIVYDNKTKESIKFNSFKEAAEYASVNRRAIWEALNMPFRKLVRKRYSFSLNFKELKKDEWEYSNKKFA